MTRLTLPTMAFARCPSYLGHPEVDLQQWHCIALGLDFLYLHTEPSWPKDRSADFSLQPFFSSKCPK